MLQLIETHDIAVPAALASLPSLKYCYLSLLIGSGAAPAPPPLPAGPRLANLRWLHYDASGLVSSTAVLHARGHCLGFSGSWLQQQSGLGLARCRHLL